MESSIQMVYIGTVFLAGIASFFSPCVFPLLPVYLARLAGEVDGQSSYLGMLARTALFIMGISVVFVPLGAGVGVLSDLFYHPVMRYVMGTIVILLGLHQMEWISFPSLQQERVLRFSTGSSRGLWSSFLLGLSFSFGWTPCVGPVLASVLAVVLASEGTPAYGAFLMAIYVCGLGLPFLLLAIFSVHLARGFEFIKRHILVLKRMGGVILILMGLLLMTNQIDRLITIFE